MSAEWNPWSLGNRGILRGVQCACGQWWPDFVPTEVESQVRTECCGALYQVQTGGGGLVTLSLLERAAGGGMTKPE